MNHEEADVDGEREENQKDSSDQEMFEEGCDGRLHVTKDDPELLDSEQPDECVLPRILRQYGGPSL